MIMIETDGKTLQQISDELASILLTQGNRCVDECGNCVYGDNQGNHCAVGWFLPHDNESLMRVEGSVSDLLYVIKVRDVSNKISNIEFINYNLAMMQLFQKLHDLKDYSNRRIISESISNAYGIDMSSWNKWIELGIR